MYEYHQKVIDQLQTIATNEQSGLDLAAQWMADTIINDKMIHAFGTGHSHMIGLELFVRAGGLANVNGMLDSLVTTAEGAQRSAEVERIPGLAEIIWDQHTIAQDDIMIVISNSGRNAMPIEMAMKAKAFGIKTIGITSRDQSEQYPSRHHSGKKLFEICDLVIDNHVPSGDGLMHIDNKLTGAASTISGVFIVNTIATEAMRIAVNKGAKLPIYHSQNIDGYSNEELYEIYQDRVKHL